MAEFLRGTPAPNTELGKPRVLSPHAGIRVSPLCLVRFYAAVVLFAQKLTIPGRHEHWPGMGGNHGLDGQGTILQVDGRFC